MKKIYRIHRKKNNIFHKKKKFFFKYQSNFSSIKQASLLKNIIYNKKEISYFNLTGVSKFKKKNSLGKSLIFVGNTSRTSIKYSFDFFYPGIEIF